MCAERMIEFTRDNLDYYLKAAAKEYRRLAGKNVPAELILVGGASVLINYGFRDMTTDIDALIFASTFPEHLSYICISRRTRNLQRVRQYLPIILINQQWRAIQISLKE